MIRTMIFAALAGTAAVAAPAVAKPGATAPAPTTSNVGVHMNTNTGINARVNSQGSMNASTNAQTKANANSAVNANANTSTSTTNAVKSQGLQHASPTGIANASPNSVLARAGVQASALPGLTTGLTVQNSSGTSLGTVSQVITGKDGSIRAVVVTDTSGKTMTLAPNTLNISGGVVTTTTGG
jgi:hypothetical protein